MRRGKTISGSASYYGACSESPAYRIFQREGDMSWLEGYLVIVPWIVSMSISVLEGHS